MIILDKIWKQQENKKKQKEFYIKYNQKKKQKEYYSNKTKQNTINQKIKFNYHARYYTKNTKENKVSLTKT